MSKTWTALTTLPGRTQAEALGHAIETLAPYGVGVFEMEDGSGLWEVGAYFTTAPDAVALALLAAAYDAAEFTVSEVPAQDWVAHVQRGLHPVEAGRFYIYGRHDAGTVPPGKTGLLIEASMAFGTGHHGTTMGCLGAFDALLANGLVPGRVADIGCGTAVLALAAAKVWPYVWPVYASDIDPLAVEVAHVNAKANDLAEAVLCLEAAGFEHPALAQAAPFDLIFANILKGPLIDLAPAMAAHLAPKGHVILSGLLTPQAQEVIDAYITVGLDLQTHTQWGEWSTLVLTR